MKFSHLIFIVSSLLIGGSAFATTSPPIIQVKVVNTSNWPLNLHYDPNTFYPPSNNLVYLSPTSLTAWGSNPASFAIYGPAMKNQDGKPALIYSATFGFQQILSDSSSVGSCNFTVACYQEGSSSSAYYCTDVRATATPVENNYNCTAVVNSEGSLGSQVTVNISYTGSSTKDARR